MASDKVERVPNPRGDLGLTIVQDMVELTHDRIAHAGMENAKRNLSVQSAGKSIADLPEMQIGGTDAAIVIAAGPSVARNGLIQKIKDSNFDGAIIACDSALRLCLAHGLIPDLIVTLDTHARRIVRWFGDPELSSNIHIDNDDYFRRQDYDGAFAEELRTNDQVISLCNQYGKNIRIALSTSSSESVVSRVRDIGMEIYWWNPMYDDPAVKGGLTRELYDMNRLPCINAGGNVGTCCWMIAHAVLGKSHVAVVGTDFAYYDGTPYEKTQYYHEAVNLFGEDDLDRVYIPVFNPHLNQRFYTDPACMWYREAFLELAADADCTTYNCTEGGILFGDNIRWSSIEEFVALGAGGGAMDGFV